MTCQYAAEGVVVTPSGAVVERDTAHRAAHHAASPVSHPRKDHRSAGGPHGAYRCH